jgi:hypothetical protein
MRFNFKKITSVLASAVMLGSTIGIAAAASTYPAPFVEGGAHDVAVVYGTNANILDGVQAGIVQTDLQTELSKQTATSGTSTGGVATGGDSVKLERSADKFNLGNVATTVYSTTINKDDMENLLADGTYLADDNDEFDYEQTISMGALSLCHFSDSEYKEDVPTLGFNLTSDTSVLNYTLDFKKDPLLNASELETTDLTLLGKTYYVLDVAAGTNKTTLLDSASSVILAEGEEETITTGAGSYVTSINFISSSEVRLDVDGEVTNSLAEGATYKLADGSYVGIKDILYTSKDTGISKVEFSIGKGKLELSATGGNIELNDASVEGIFSWLVPSGANLDKVVLEWKTEDKEFVTPEDDLVIPGFENVKITMGEINKPLEEEITVKYDGSTKIKLTAPIKDGTAGIHLLYANTTGDFIGIGKDASNKLVTAPPATNSILYNYTAGDRSFIASWNTSTEGQSYWLYISSGDVEKDSNDINITTIRNMVIVDSAGNHPVAGSCEDKAPSSSCKVGDIELTINSVHRSGSDKWVNISINTGGSFNRIYTEEGLEINLPYTRGINDTTPYGAINLTDIGGTTAWGSTAGHGYNTFYLYMVEEDKDGNLGTGDAVYVTADDTSSNKVHISDVEFTADEFEIDDTDDYEAYTVSDLATKVIYNTGGDEDWATITYHGDQVFADVFVAAPDVTVSGGGTGGGTVSELGNVVVTDAEINSVKAKNLIVVGGTCINSVAAEILGGAFCGADFTNNGGVGPDQFLIKVVDSPYTTGQIAMLVAGYEVADTVKAVTYVTEETDVSTDVGTELKLATATYASVA